jgi:hypothetical protein
MTKHQIPSQDTHRHTTTLRCRVAAILPAPNSGVTQRVIFKSGSEPHPFQLLASPVHMPEIRAAYKRCEYLDVHMRVTQVRDCLVGDVLEVYPVTDKPEAWKEVSIDPDGQR